MPKISHVYIFTPKVGLLNIRQDIMSASNCDQNYNSGNYKFGHTEIWS